MGEDRTKIDGKVHNKRCEDARPKSPCRCRCHGQFHAKTLEDAQAEKIRDAHIKSISMSMGGEIEKELKDLMGQQYECPCGSINTIGALEGYPHDDGLKDKDGKGWWVYQTCDKCHHDLSFWKFRNRVERLEKSKQEFIADHSVQTIAG